jgi:hypothetical protein
VDVVRLVAGLFTLIPTSPDVITVRPINNTHRKKLRSPSCNNFLQKVCYLGLSHWPGASVLFLKGTSIPEHNAMKPGSI